MSDEANKSFDYGQGNSAESFLQILQWRNLGFRLSKTISRHHL